MTDESTIIPDQYFDRWLASLPRRSVCLQEAFQVFREDLYGLCMEKIGCSAMPDAYTRPYWVEMLWKLKRWAENPLDVAGAKRFPIATLLERYGIPVRLNMARCVFHEDKTASMSLKYNRFHCFGCGAKGDVIDFVQRRQGLSFPEAVKTLL